MKKSFKLLVPTVAIMVLFLNVSLDLNNDKVEGISFTMKTKTASAADMCWMNPDNFTCDQHNYGYYCGTVNPTTGNCYFE